MHKENKVAVLIVDEAQRLSMDLLEEVRLLTNFETDKEKLIQVILAGQDELADILDRYDLRQLKQRISTRLHIRPLMSRCRCCIYPASLESLFYWAPAI